MCVLLCARVRACVCVCVCVCLCAKNNSPIARATKAPPRVLMLLQSLLCDILLLIRRKNEKRLLLVARPDNPCYGVYVKYDRVLHSCRNMLTDTARTRHATLNRRHSRRIRHITYRERCTLLQCACGCRCCRCCCCDTQHTKDCCCREFVGCQKPEVLLRFCGAAAAAADAATGGGSACAVLLPAAARSFSSSAAPT